MIVTAVSTGSKTYWYLTRATGGVALVLFTAVMILGVVNVARLSSDRWPRFAIDSLHRTVSLLALAFLVVHILTSVLDTFAPIGVLDAVIPFHSAYRPLWLAFGAISFDLLLAVLITSLVRVRLGFGAWRLVHWLAYASWPIAVLHTLGSGSDVKQGWMLLLTAVCVIAVAMAVTLRVATTPQLEVRLRVAAVAASLAFAVGLAVWLPSGPLGHGWAARAGTPANLLPGSTTTNTATR